MRFIALESVGLGRLESRGFLGGSSVFFGESGPIFGESSACFGDSGAMLAMLPGVTQVSSCQDSSRGNGGNARLRSTAFFDSEVEPLRCVTLSSPGSKLFLPVLLLEFLLCRELRCESCIGVSLAGFESDLALTKDSCDLAFKFAKFGGTSRLCLPWEVPGLK